jgi:uncharacterized membrane protein
MIQGIDLKWWLALIAFGGLSICLGAAVIDSVPFSTVGGILIGWAAGVWMVRKSAARALEMLEENRATYHPTLELRPRRTPPEEEGT